MKTLSSPENRECIECGNDLGRSADEPIRCDVCFTAIGYEERLDALTQERDEARAELMAWLKEADERFPRIVSERDEALAQLEQLRELHDLTANVAVAAVAEVKQRREQARWIPVEERLPDADGIYAVKLRGGVVGRSTPGDWWAAEFFADAEHPEWYGVSSPVTHWMALPELTEGETK